MTKPVRKAVFPVAGLGTRFLPATKAMPKEMLPIVDKPLIQYAVEEAREAGIDEFIFVTGRAKTPIEDHFDHSVELEQTLAGRGDEAMIRSISEWMPPPGHIAYTRQQAALGLGHAVWCARNFIASNEPFAVLLADDLILGQRSCLAQLIDHYDQVGGHMVGIETIPREHTTKYGILDVESEDGPLVKARGLVEKPTPDEAPSTLAITGRYILDPIVLTVLSHQQRGRGGEIQLTDALARTINIVPFHGLKFDGRRFDCGNKVGYLEANIAYALQRPDMGDSVRELLKRYLTDASQEIDETEQPLAAVR